MPWDGLPLAWSIGLVGESPRNVVNVILHGIPPAPGGETTPMMPGYAGALDDAQVESRKMTPSMLLFPPGGTRFDPAKTP